MSSIEEKYQIFNLILIDTATITFQFVLSFSLLFKEAKLSKVGYLLPQICPVDRPYQKAQLSQETQHQVIQGCLVFLVFQVIHRGRLVL